ncbi:hypothetical protein N9917_00630 [Deltaproteobacteria bacterium]|nr:hypothetical protein [Deltaproteobacteria bacterium]
MSKSRRPETGPMQFGNDWGGVFIRGDNAAGFGLHLKMVLEKSTADPLTKASVEGFLSTLSGSDERGHTDETPVQKLAPWHRCQPGHISFDITEKENLAGRKWLDEHDLTCDFGKQSRQGAIGGRITYGFTRTSIGVIAKMTCACGEHVILSDFSNW